MVWVAFVVVTALDMARSVVSLAVIYLSVGYNVRVWELDREEGRWWSSLCFWNERTGQIV